jgi:glycosyltransferase involved in cell wall biosynthesis
MLQSRSSKMLLVGVWANRNWILGNWLKEVKLRKSNKFKIMWIPTIYSGKRNIEKLLPAVLPRYGSYFFSYLTIFERYLKTHQDLVEFRSIVLYPHNEPELGSIAHQVKILNRASRVYFFCSSDARNLVIGGLDESKVVIAFCAVDVDCVPEDTVDRIQNLVVLASNYGPRKGLEILPEIVAKRPNIKFIGLGRRWENFIQNSGLNLLPNFEYVHLNKTSRNEYFSKAKYFLSLSNLEGGPVPLIEAMAMGVFPIATNTGFAPDLIKDDSQGLLISTNPKKEEVLSALDKALYVKDFKPRKDLTWDRITAMMIQDQIQIINSKHQKN